MTLTNRAHGLAPMTGQALVETLVAMLALLALWMAVAWLGRLQDMALQAAHGARYAAFMAAQDASADAWVSDGYFQGAGHEWRDRRGHSVLPAQGQGAEVQLNLLAALPDKAQPGQGHASARQLRHDWHTADAGVVRATVQVQPVASPMTYAGPAWAGHLRGFDLPYPLIRRQAFILQGSGHAGGDAQAQQRITASPLAWGQAAQTSQTLSARVTRVMQAVDAGWGRPAPQQDWLQAWQGQVPQQHLHPTGATP